MNEEMKPQVEQDLRKKETSSDKNLSRGGRWSRVLGTAAITGAVALGGAEVAHSEEKSGESCPVIGVEQIESARSFLDQPDAPELAQMLQLDSDSGQFKDWARDKAAEHNLTLVKNEPFIDKIKQATSSHEGVTALNKFTSEYGFGVTFKEDLSLKDVKEGGEKLMRAFTNVPKELVDASHVKQVVIGEKDSSSLGSISVDKDDFMDGKGYLHKFSHQLDGATCGDGEAESEDKSKLIEKMFPAFDPDTFGKDASDQEKTLKALSRLQSQVASADPSADTLGYLKSISILQSESSNSDAYKVLVEKYKDKN